MPLDMGVLDFARKTAAGGPTADEGILETSRQIQGMWAPVQQPARNYEDEFQAKQLEWAQGQLEASPLPFFKAYGVAAGAPIVAGVARAVGQGEYADKMIRGAAAIEQAQQEREKGGIVPDILQSSVRGAGASLTSVVPATMLGGPAAGIAVATAQQTNTSITEGKDAGLKGGDLAAYAAAQGAWEGIPSGVMQALGLGGIESAIGRGTISSGIREALKRFGKDLAHEEIEEFVTFFGQSFTDYLSNVDPEAMSVESLKQGAYQTAVQTAIGTAMVSAPGLAKAHRRANTEREILDSAASDRAPSVKQWKQWGLPTEMGDSRSKRAEVVQFMADQINKATQQAQEAPEAQIEAPAEPVEAVVVPEVPEIAPEPVAVPEAPRVAEAAAPVTEDPTVGFRKVETMEIREEVGLEQLPQEDSQVAQDVLDNVLATNGADDAVGIAVAVNKKPRGLTPREHVSLFVEARRLLDQKSALLDKQAELAAASDSVGYDAAIAQEDVIVDSIDKLTAAAQHSGTKLSKAFNIRKMRLNRDKYDVASILQRVRRVSKSPGESPKEVKDLAKRLSKEIEAQDKKISELEERDKAREEELERALAGKVLTSRKPRGKVGRSIKEKARKDREYYKDRIRKLGEVGRVNDITGISVEGLYLIGQIGITYAREGVGSLVEITENLRKDFSDLDLTIQDVSQAINTRSPKQKARARTKGAKNVTKIKRIAAIHVELDQMAQGIFEKTKRNVAPVPADLKALVNKLAKARHAYYYSEMEGAKVERAIDKLTLLQSQLGNGVKRIKKSPKVVPPELADIRGEISDITSILNTREAIVKIEKQIADGVLPVPLPKKKRVVSKELELERVKLKQLKRQVAKMIEDAAPWGAKRVVGEAVATLKTVITVGEISFVARQNVLQSAAHPILAAKSLLKSFEPIVSQEQADRVNNRLENSANGEIYQLTGLAILDNESTVEAERSEVYRANVIQKVPVLGSIIRGSGRHAVTYSNLMRAGGMDRFIAMYPNATRAELNAWADWQNTSSGLGTLFEFAQAAKILSHIFFAPKFTASRIQTPFKVFKYWKMPRVRKEIAKDMAKFVSTGIGVLYAADLAGFSVEWRDWSDPDWGKIRIGNTRYDIWGSYLQLARLIARVLGTPLERIGLIEPGYGDFSPWDLFSRFAAFKLSPAITIISEALTGKTILGEDVTPGDALLRHIITLFLQDIREVGIEEGYTQAIGTIPVAAVGTGVSTYEDRLGITRYRAGRALSRGRPAEARRLVRDWNRGNENKIRSVKYTVNGREKEHEF